MTCLVLFEHQHVYRGEATNGRKFLPEAEFNQLRRFDEQRAGKNGDFIFEWHPRWMKAQKWVGVIQLGDTTVEILPKIGAVQKDGGGLARSTFLRMLTYSGALPFHEQNLASQTARRAPLLDALALTFGDHLKEELLKGPYRSYLPIEENLYKLKGRLNFQKHLRLNIARRDRFFVRHDELTSDNPLNRTLKAAVSLLMRTVRTSAAHERLRQCSALLQGVSDVGPSKSQRQEIHLNRRSARFRYLFRFACLILDGKSTDFSRGPERSFAMLFDLQGLFESFTVEFLRRHVLTTEMLGGIANNCTLYTQRGPQRLHLIHRVPSGPDQNSKPSLALEPDICIEVNYPDRRSRVCILDTKWKRLSRTKSPRQGVTRADVHQMYAYAQSYDANHTVLLYPDSGVAEERSYSMPSRTANGVLEERFLHVRFVNLAVDLQTAIGRTSLATDLARVVHEGITDTSAITGVNS